MNKELLKILYSLIDKDFQVARLSAASENEAKLVEATFGKIKDDFKVISELLPKEA